VGSIKRIFSARVRTGRSRSSKVIDFGTNQKHLWDILLVRHSKLGPILHHFRDTAGSLLMTHPYFHPNIGCIPTGTDRQCWGQPEPKASANQPWNYFRSIATHV